MIGDIGGLNDALILIFNLIVSIFTGSLFYMNLVPSVFAVHHESAKAQIKRKKHRKTTKTHPEI